MKSYLLVALVALSTANLYSANPNPVTPPRPAAAVDPKPPAIVRRQPYNRDLNPGALQALGQVFHFNFHDAELVAAAHPEHPEHPAHPPAFGGDNRDMSDTE